MAKAKRNRKEPENFGSGDHWVCLWVMESAVWDSPALFQVWAWCLLKANHKPKIWRGIKLQPGQFVTGRHRAAEELGMPMSSVWDRLRKIQALGNADIKSDSQYSIITICNWGRYQYTRPPARQLTRQRSDSDPTLLRRKDVKQQKKKQHGGGGDSPEGFLRFWEVWPKHKRKTSRAKCLARWRADGLEARADHVVGVVGRLVGSDEWRREAGRFIPAPLVWLNSQRWDCAPGDVPTATEQQDADFAEQCRRAGWDPPIVPRADDPDWDWVFEEDGQ